MPFYVYKREDGSTFELRQRVSDERLEVCPDTGQKVKRIIQPTNWHFTGGFARQDYDRTFATAPKED